jgi:magnesium transporter
MPDVLYSPEIKLMLVDNDADGLRALCENLHPATMASALDEFEPLEIWDVVSHADIAEQTAIFEYLPSNRQIGMLSVERSGSGSSIGKLIGKMSHDDRADLLQQLPTSAREKLLRVVDEADRKDIATLVDYDDNSVGAIMTTDYAWLPPTMTAAEAIDQLRQQAPDRETIYYIYVLDELRKRSDGATYGRKLLGVVSLRLLILSARDTPIRDLMRDEVVALRYDDAAEKAGQVLAKYDFIAVPVLDAEGGMLGIVTHDDVIDVIQEEATEDLQRQGGVGPIEGNYLEAPFLRVWWSRFQWLAMLFLLQMITVNVMDQNEEKLEIAKVLVVCLPLMLSVGGNSGSQAATLVVRALSLEQVRPNQWLIVFRRELLVGTVLGITLGVLALVRTYYLTPSHLVNGPGVLIKTTMVMTSAVMALCLWGTLVGSMLPLVIRKLGGDPALVSSPAIATISDVSGIIIYANIAMLIF